MDAPEPPHEESSASARGFPFGLLEGCCLAEFAVGTGLLCLGKCLVAVIVIGAITALVLWAISRLTSLF